jgi:hypothetical protein
MGTLLPLWLPGYNLFQTVLHMKSTKRFVNVASLVAPHRVFLLRSGAIVPESAIPCNDMKVLVTTQLVFFQ